MRKIVKLLILMLPLYIMTSCSQSNNENQTVIKEPEADFLEYELSIDTAGIDKEKFLFTVDSRGKFFYSYYQDTLKRYKLLLNENKLEEEKSITFNSNGKYARLMYSKKFIGLFMFDLSNNIVGHEKPASIYVFDQELNTKDTIEFKYPINASINPVNLDYYSWTSLNGVTYLSKFFNYIEIIQDGMLKLNAPETYFSIVDIYTGLVYNIENKDQEGENSPSLILTQDSNEVIDFTAAIGNNAKNVKLNPMRMADSILYFTDRKENYCYDLRNTDKGVYKTSFDSQYYPCKALGLLGFMNRDKQFKVLVKQE